MIERVTVYNLTTGENVMLDMEETVEYVLESFEIDPLTVQHTTQPLPSLYGETVTNTRYNSRKLKIVGWVIPSTNESISEAAREQLYRGYKHKLSNLFVPSDELKLKVKGVRGQDQNVQDFYLLFICDNAVTFGETPDNNNEYMCRFEVTGTCVIPFFEYTDRLNRTIETQENVRSFVDFTNYGHIPVGIEIDAEILTLTYTTTTSGWFFVDVHKENLYGEQVAHFEIHPFQMDSIVRAAVGDHIYINTCNGKEEITLIKSNGKRYNYAGSIDWNSFVIPCLDVRQKYTIITLCYGCTLRAQFSIKELYTGVD